MFSADSLATDTLVLRDSVSSSPMIEKKDANPNYDSILNAVDSNALMRSEFYRTGVTLPDNTIPMTERSYSIANDDWLVGGIALLFFIMATILYHSRKLVISHLKDFFSTTRQYSDENINESSSDISNAYFLTVISAVSISLVYFDYMNHEFQFNPALGIPYWILGVGFVLSMVFIYAKAWIYVLVNWVFFDSESSKKWMSGYFLLTALTAFFLFPISLVNIFFDNSFKIVTVCVILVALVYEILLFFKLLVNFKTRKYGYLLIFLYFCSVEVIPAIVLWSILSWTTDSIIVKNLLY